ncbi:MAG: hypothetical protein AAGU75_15490 [Bacillota bacterium]
MLKQLFQKAKYVTAASVMALVALTAAPVTEMCTIIMLDDVAIPESLIKTE